MSSKSPGRHRPSTAAPRRRASILLAAAVIAAAAGTGVLLAAEKVREDISRPPAAPAHVTGDAVTTPSTTPGPRVDIWASYGCPDCEATLSVLAGPLEHARSTGAATVSLHLGSTSRDAARIVDNAVACVADEYDPSRAVDVWMSLVPYPQSAPVQTTVSEATAQMGLATPRLVSCVTGETFTGWLAHAAPADAATPSPRMRVSLNGEPSTATEVAAALNRAVDAAGADTSGTNQESATEPSTRAE